MRIEVPLLALILAACAPPSDTPTPAQEDVAAAPAPAAIVGAYTAMSTTAMSITGDLDATPDVLSFARGFRLEGGRIDAALAGDTDLSAGGGTINSGSGVEVTDVELRRVDTVRVAADAPAPSLCAGATATHVILGRAGDVLTLQVFSGADAPGPNAHDTALCGIFNYSAAG